MRSQKRRVQRLRNKELEQAQVSGKPQVWCAKQIADRKQPSANIQMAFLLPSEFRAPVNQEVYSDFDESEYEEMVAKLTVMQQAIFDRPVKHRHLKGLYMKGFVDGKPMNKMLVDGGAFVNLMPYTTFLKLSKGLGDLIETDMMLKDFRGNTSKTWGAINVELTIGSKTLLTTFFVIDGKRAIQFAPWSGLDSCELVCTIDHASVFDSMAWR